MPFPAFSCFLAQLKEVRTADRFIKCPNCIRNTLLSLNKLKSGLCVVNIMNQAAIFFFLLLPLLLANFVKVAIVGTNDIHGSALPTQLHRPDLNQNYTYGGLEYLASMVDTLRH